MVRAVQSPGAMDKKMKKLALSRETIRPLTRDALRGAAGAEGRTIKINTTSIDKTAKQVTLTLLVGLTCTTEWTQSDLWTCPITSQIQGC